MKHFVYKITNTVNDRFYIGKHSGQVNDLGGKYNGSSEILNHAYNKHGIENFTFEIIAFCNTSDEAYQAEVRLLKDVWMLPECYNITNGGNGAGSGEGHSLYGKNHSEKTLKKMSEAKKGIRRSEETRKKIGEGGIGRKCSEETRKRLSGAKKGIKLSKEHKMSLKGIRRSEETRQKIKEANIGKILSEETKQKIGKALNKGVYQCTLEGKLIAYFDSIKIAASHVKVSRSSISQCCKGRRNTCGGFKWVYKQNKEL